MCLLACVDKKSPLLNCDPQVEDCSIGPGGSGRCTQDSDCGDGVCQLDTGTCRAAQPVTQPTACANLSCPPGNFCSNGQCIPASAQCKQADPACIFIPHGSFEPPEHAWWWPWQTPLGPDAVSPADSFRADLEYPDYVQVMSTPVVMRLHPTDKEPAVVFNTFPEHPTGEQGSEILEVQGVMRAVRGSDGTPLWTAPKDMWSHMNLSVNGNSGIAAGDCMGTGETCFITGGWDPQDEPPRVPDPKSSHQHGGLIAFGSDGRLLWETREAQLWWGAPVIARMLGPAGPAQVVVGNGVFDGATGKTLCPQTNVGGAVGGNGDGTLSAVADLDLDGVPEIVTGNQAYKLVKNDASPTGYSCKAMFGDGVKMPRNLPCAGGVGSLCPEGFPAVASFAAYGSLMGLKPEDPHPQVAVVSQGYLRIHDWTGGLLLNPIPLPINGYICGTDYNPGGAPTIADFDGDGMPEIGVASQSAYSVWKPGKGWIWSSPTFDCSANTGSSVFDFEGKGQATVVYSDQCFFHVLDGKSGQQLIKEPNFSCTAYEMPIVADIDGTGRAKILVPNNNICQFDQCNKNWPSTAVNRYVGLKALRSPSDKWVNTRSVWNQHTYHVTNVNLDGTLPFPEPSSWAKDQSNSYRQNVQGQGQFSSPDLSLCAIDVDMSTCRTGPAKASAVVYNGGAIAAMPGVTVDFYAVLENGQTAHIGQAKTTRRLQPGDSEPVSVDWQAPPQSQGVRVKGVVDEKAVIGDCHVENNTVTTANPVKCSPLG
ncbi:MAG TPA: CARDB domain-containing protein [Myxococcales bacterium]|nr:CARDB domain-containing protein [Myxococcales bacterium]